jgi:hypothetical protein
MGFFFFPCNFVLFVCEFVVYYGPSHGTELVVGVSNTEGLVPYGKNICVI